MIDPQFETSTPRYALPMLFAAQAQKETFVNESLARLDALAHPAIEAIAASPPLTVLDGQMWLVAEAGANEWEGHSDCLAMSIDSQWLFIAPRDGLRLFNRATGEALFYNNGWTTVQTILPPAGGNVIDLQARDAINALLNRLANAGILPPT